MGSQMTERIRRPRRFHLAHLLLSVQLSAILFFCLRTATDPDYGWHIANGRHVFDGMTFSGRDIYSWTATNVWIAHEWLTEAMMYLVDASLGPTGNSVLFGIFGVATYALVARQLRWRERWSVTLIVLPICFAGSMRSLGVRPLMLELLYLAFLLSVIDRYLARSITRTQLLLVAGLGAVLWANTHGSFLLMPGVLGITAAEMFIARDARWRELTVAGLISLVAPIVNPWGWGLFEFATQSITSQTTLIRIQEWQRPVLNEALAIPLLVQLIVASVGIIALLLPMRRGPASSAARGATLGILRTVVFGVLALKSGRHMMLFGVAAAPIIAVGIRSILQWAQVNGNNEDEFEPAAGDHGRTVINLAAAFLIVIGVTHAAWREISPSAQVEALRARYPVGAASHLSRSMAPSDRLLNEYGWGGFLIQRNILPVFIDGRSELYGDAQLERYAALIHLEPGWREIVDSLNIDLVLMPRHGRLALALERDGWEVVARDSVSSLLGSARKKNGGAEAPPSFVR